MSEPKPMTKEEMQKLIEALDSPMPGSELIGFIGTAPVYANPAITGPGLYCISEEAFIKMGEEDETKIDL